jgi:tRNA(Ile)-lysidine synthase
MFHYRDNGLQVAKLANYCLARGGQSTNGRLFGVPLHMPLADSKRSALALQVQHYIAAHHLLQPGGRLLLAISGGPDSVALLHLLLELGYEPALAHVNFKLRGADADADEAFVRTLAKQHNLAAHFRSVDTQHYAHAHAQSIQTAARNLRYAFFDELVRSEAFAAVATAHHQNDQAETVLYNLLRGKSFNVLSGIPLQRGVYVRPLLGIAKQALLAYLHDRNLPYREDASNAESKYDRNQLRLHVLPAMAAVAGDPGAQLAERTQLYHWQQQLLHETLDALAGVYIKTGNNESVFHAADMLQHTPRYQVQLLLYYYLCEKLGLAHHDVLHSMSLLDAQTGRQVQTERYRLVQDRGTIVISPRKAGTTPPHSPIVLQQTGSFFYNGIAITVGLHAGPLPDAISGNVIYFAADALRGPLQVRPWQPGDAMVPLGLRGSKKVSDVLTDAKFPTTQRAQVFVLADDDGVVYVQGYRIAERVKVTTITSKIWEVRFTYP